MKNIKWDNNVRGYLSENENLDCNEIDTLIDVINQKGYCLRIIISIEGGNQFHIRDNEGCLLGYLSSHDCRVALKAMLATLNYLQEGN